MREPQNNLTNIGMRIKVKREQQRRRAARKLWTFCRIIDDPRYYSKDKWHLRLFCETLELLYYRRLNRVTFLEVVTLYAPPWFRKTQDFKEMYERLDERKIYVWFMINLPPRSGKTRTLTHFTQWALGRNPKESIMTATYNDDLAQDFSRMTRDGIAQERDNDIQLVYSDIFPNSTIQYGQAAAAKWTLDNGYRSYTGVGIGGSSTGRGGSIMQIDDPIKDSKTAYNQRALDEINTWYSATMFSRLEKGAIAIVNHTRWAKSDLCGYLLEKENGLSWFVFKLPAVFEDVGELLDPVELDAARLKDIRIILPRDIYEANYNQKTIDEKGRLYTAFRTYSTPPPFEKIVSYTDSADDGEDYYCLIVAGIYHKRAYILDVIHTDAPQQETEILAADAIEHNQVDNVIFEGNNGGKGQMLATQRLTDERGIFPAYSYFHQSENKIARILSQQTNVNRRIVMPEDWAHAFPSFYKSITEYQRKGKNKHDDAPDALTGLVEKHLEDTNTLRIGMA